MNKNLKYFMRDSAKEEKIFEVPGLETIKDDSGNIVPLKIKRLHNSRIREIHDMYKTRKPLKDNKGNFIVQNGEAVFAVEKDSERAGRHIIAEALVEPDLKDKDLMKFFNCVDITKMPLLVFPESEEYAYVNRKVMEIIGLIDPEEKDEKELEDAKN